MLQANIGLAAGAGSGIYASGKALASRFEYDVLVDDGIVAATVSLGATIPAMDVGAHADAATAIAAASPTNQVIVSPCGPAPYANLQETTCALLPLDPGSGPAHLKASSGSLLCAAYLDVNGMHARVYVCVCVSVCVCACIFSFASLCLL